MITAILLLTGFTLRNMAEAQTPVELHGRLRVEGNKILDEQGDTVQLRGMSFFWSQWMGKYYHKKTVNWLADDWKVTVVRAALGVKHTGSQSGYLYDGSEKKKVTAVVEAALKKGIYVIIDWHDHFAYKNLKESRQFFEEMARRYGEYPNIIYEIYNEPERVSWSETVKPYARSVVKAIRGIDPDNLIIIGTPYWCQHVDESARNPLKGQNLAYALHFYAASHGADIREKARYALEQGIPLFVSEFGTCLASGDGFLDSLETEAWFGFMDEHKLSWCNWSIADKPETASALVPGARYSGGWKQKDLTRSGRIIRHKLRQYSGIIDAPAEKEKGKKSWFRVRPLR
ncbi:glycoside hydrolase family 5 protein [Fibrobacterota bacterium]